MKLYLIIASWCSFICKTKAQTFTQIIEQSLIRDLISVDTSKSYTFIYGWATWCKPCITHLDTLNTLVKKYPYVKFIQIVYDSSEAYERFVYRNEKQLNFDCIVNGQQLLNQLAAIKFTRVEKGMALPMIFILNKEHKPIWVQKRFSTKTLKEINNVLSQP